MVEVLPENSEEFTLHFGFPSRRHIPRAVRLLTEFTISDAGTRHDGPTEAYDANRYVAIDIMSAFGD